MATAPNYTRVSPGLYRSPTGQIVRQGQIPKPGSQPTATNNPVQNSAPTYSTTYRQGGNNTYRTPDGKVVSGNLMKTMTDRFNRYAKDFGGLAKEDARYNAMGQNIKDLGTKYGFDFNKVLGQNWTPYQAPAPQPEAPPTTEAPPAEQTPPASEPAPTPPPVVGSQYADYQSPMTAALMKAFGQGVNTMQAYEPKNFEGSPLYQFQKQKGMQDMEKLMAARGLTGSGAEVQANSDFLANINAQEAEKQRQYADQAAQRQQGALEFIARFDQAEKEALRNQWNTDLDRQTNINQFEANRGDRRQELATNFLQNILNMQSNNDIARLSQTGLNQQTALTDQLMKAIAGFTANNFPRVSGGGGGTPPTAPSPMSGDLDLMKILTGYGNRAGNNDVWNGVFETLFGKGK